MPVKIIETHTFRFAQCVEEMQRAAALAIGVLSPKLVVNADSTTEIYSKMITEKRIKY